MKTWRSTGRYFNPTKPTNDWNIPYYQRYTKTYEVDVDENNRLAVDLGIKSGFCCNKDDIEYGIDEIKPINFKVNPRRVHLDIEVSTEKTKKIPTWTNPIEPIYSIANFDNYDKYFTFFIQHPEYKNNKLYNTEYKQILIKSIKDKINNIKSEYKLFNIKYEHVKNLDINLSELNIDEIENEEYEFYKDYITYTFEKEKFENELKEFKSRLNSIIKLFKNKYPVKIRTFNNEYDMLNEFIEYIDDNDPDIITGWNTQRFDMPYLIERMKHIGCNYKNLSPLEQVYMKKKQGIAVIKGRIIFDTWKGYKKIQTKELESLKLDIVGKGLFALGKVEHQGINWMYHNDRKLLAKYNIQDVFLEYAIAETQGIFEFFYDVKTYVGCSFEDVLNNSQIVDTYMLFKSKEKKLVLPSKVKNEYEKFKGANVIQPDKEGISKYVFVLDLKSLYPYCMLSLNMGEDTLVINQSKKDIHNLIKSPIDGIYFRKDKQSFLAGAIKELLDYRNSIKIEIKDLFKIGNTSEANIKNRIQKVVKFITNSIYGVIGWHKFRLYNRDIARTITATARRVIEYTIEKCEEWGFKVHYGDTDSVFIIIENIKDINKIKDLMLDIAEKLNQSYDIFKSEYNIKEHFFKMKAEKLFKHLFMVKKKDKDDVAKKRYVGWLLWNDDMKLDELCNKLYVSGFDRSDMSRVGNKIMKKVLLLSACNLIKSISPYIKEEVKKIKNWKYQLEDIAFSKGISSPLEEYAKQDWIEGARWTNAHSYLWNKQTDFGATSKPKYIFLNKKLIPKPYIKLNNGHNYQLVALDDDFELPNELLIKTIKKKKNNKIIKKKINVVDFDTLIEKTVKDKIDTSLEAVGLNWDTIIPAVATQNLLNI